MTENTGDRGRTAVVRIVRRRGVRRRRDRAGAVMMMMMVVMGGGGILQVLVHVVRARGRVVLRTGSGVVAVARRRGRHGSGGRGRVTIPAG